MQTLIRHDRALSWELHRPADTADRARTPLVFANSLGTDTRVWHAVTARLSPRPILLHDMHGHGLSEGTGPVSVHDMAGDLDAIIDAAGLKTVVVVGLSVGGMVAQALAARRPGLVRGLVLSNTAHRIGTHEAWNARIADVSRLGMAGMATPILERWFAPGFHKADPGAWRACRRMLLAQPAEGYAAVCAAIRDADLTQSSAAIGVPTLCLAGADDAATPPDLVAELAALIPGAKLETLDACGHIPPLEAPGAMAERIDAFMRGFETDDALFLNRSKTVA